MQFESSLQKAKIECLRTTTSFEDYMEKFETKKIQDLKVMLESCDNQHMCQSSSPQAILGEYMHTQMTFHAKALELYTIAYQNLQSINEEEEAQVSKFLFGYK